MTTSTVVDDGTKSLQLDKPLSDTRLYRHIVLPNKLEVLLISDPQCDRAACSMNVGIGSLFDPPDLQGLAHFLEHMLFLGTKKYPDEDEYSRYLQQHGGDSNAYTSDLNTCYHFSVAVEHLEGAVDRFAQFFLDPLFTPSATTRELDAVNSEHAKNTLSDIRREYQLLKDLANPAHPFSHFGTGNHSTLRDIPAEKGIDVREALLAFHKKYYSGNIMRLCILGRESLDELETMIKQERFECILNNDVEVPKGDAIGGQQIPFRNEDLGQLVRVIPVRDTRSISFQWVLPEQTDLWETKPTRYICHLPGHEGKGSLLSVLKKEKLATELFAGSIVDCAGVTLFRCRIELSETALNSPSGIERIGHLVFKYIQLLQSNPIQDWVNEEMDNLAQIEFKFLSQCDPVQRVVGLSHCMHIYPPLRLISAPYLFWKHDCDQIKSILEYFRPDNMSVFVITRAFSKLAEENSGAWRKATYYQTMFQVESISKKLLDAWNQSEAADAFPQSDLFFPLPNPFIPQDLSLKPKATLPMPAFPTKLPAIDGLRMRANIFFKQDDTFNLPKVAVLMRFSSPYLQSALQELSIMELYFLTIQQILNEYTYDAVIAGLEYSLCASIASGHIGEIGGFELQVAGYNDAVPRLLTTICKAIKEPELQEKAFDIAKSILMRDLKILASNKQPYQQVVNNMKRYIQVPYYTAEERLPSIEKVTFDDIKRIAATGQHVDNLFMEALIQGNVVADEAKALVKIADDSFYGSEKKDIGTLDCTPSRVPDLTYDQSTPVRYRLTKPGTHEEDPNSASSVTMLAGLLDINDSAFLNLAKNYLHQPFFDTLRTKQQLGYIVGASAMRTLHCYGISLLVQSQCVIAKEITQRIEAFIEYYMQHIEDRLTEEDFNKLRLATISQLEEKPKRISQEATKNYVEVVLRRNRFDRRVKQCEFLQTATRAQFIDFIHRKLLNAPWFVSEVVSTVQLASEKSIFCTNVVTTDETEDVMNKGVDKNDVPLAPTTSTQWVDVDLNPDVFLRTSIKKFIDFPIPCTTSDTTVGC